MGWSFPWAELMGSRAQAGHAWEPLSARGCGVTRGWAEGTSALPRGQLKILAQDDSKH